ncbi:MAG: AAA family ATPase [Gammaproteobacteria bacterium WSBS_2016_MAG_OTU1]
MKITHAQIKNFRALEYIDVPLNQFSIILGENDVGKTSFIYALQSFFAGKKLDKQDWYKQDDTNPIEITLSLKGVSDNVEAKDSLRKDRTMTIQGCFSSGESPKFFEVLDDGSKSEIKSAAMKKLSLGEHFIFIPVSRDIGTQLSMAKTALLGKMMRARMNQAIEEKGANKLIEEITEILREFRCKVREKRWKVF